MSATRNFWFGSRSNGNAGTAAVALLEQPLAENSHEHAADRLAEEGLGSAQWLDADPRVVIAVDRNDRLVYINPAAEELAGRRLGQVVGMPAWELFDSPECRDSKSPVVEAMRKGSAADLDVSITIAGKKKYFHMLALPRWDKKKQTIGAIVWCQDITANMRVREETKKVLHAFRQGDLSARGDTSNFTGTVRFKELVEDMNEMLDAVLRPLNNVLKLLELISLGNIPPKVTDTVHGDFNKIKDNINLCIESINALVADAVMLAQAGVAGKLNVRADVTKHNGDYRKIIEGVNATLDAILGPFKEVNSVIGQMASGDLTRQITGEYAGDFNQMKTAVNTLSAQFGGAIRQISTETSSLVTSAHQLNSVSEQMGTSADETATQANVVSAAADQVSKNVQTVATGADEMGASIKEIAKSTAEATRVANMAVKTAGATNQTIAKLGQSSAEIGQVIKVITSIAQQTNLLALNATIEAARAGEAGKGFAVVANEVKELAKETAKATEDISQKIEAIQGDTKGAVSAIGEISGIIAQISDIQNTIASAIEEQSATTNEIIRNLSEAAKGSSDISRNIGGVAEAARVTSSGAGETQQSAKSLERLAADLQALIAQFKA
ncbi:MAG: methyl-accepting chemotaxis protein [Acidobacteria bacterium]|nr:MAG: methyl-accepting chemotaxis protein [Acidobacteriota bacterium]